MNLATAITIESILDDTRPADATDYREWGRAAGRVLADHREQATDVLIEAMTAKARQRIAREQSRTRDGIARFVADQETGQLSAWADWTDTDKLRQTGLRLVKEGDKKIRLGQLMQQAADCIEAHSSGRVVGRRTRRCGIGRRDRGSLGMTLAAPCLYCRQPVWFFERQGWVVGRVGVSRWHARCVS